MPNRTQGYTLVELIAVLVLIAVISAVSLSSLVPNTSLQLQASRDTIVAAFFSAQQRAMAQTSPVQVILSGSSIDIRMDANGDGSFVASESIFIGGVQYPVALIPGQTLTSATFDFDRLGRTNEAILDLSQSGSSVNIRVSSNGAVN